MKIILLAPKNIDYKNPYEKFNSTEDEAAITDILFGMMDYINTGKEIYPMRGSS